MWRERRKKKENSFVRSIHNPHENVVVWHHIFFGWRRGKKSDENANDFSELGRRKTGKNKNEKGEIFLISTLF
jgi:hypothetical protein